MKASKKRNLTCPVAGCRAAITHVTLVEATEIENELKKHHKKRKIHETKEEEDDYTQL